MTSGDHLQAPILLGHIVHGDPRGNEGNRIETEIRAVLMIGLLDAPRRLHKELLAFQLDIRTKQAFNDVEDFRIPVLEAAGEGTKIVHHPSPGFRPRLSLFNNHLRTVLAVKGSLRRAQQRRALDGSGPFLTKSQ